MTRFKNFVCAALCTSFGFGYSRIAPGSAGTIPAVGLFIVIVKTVAPELQTLIIAKVLALACLLCVLLGPWAEKYWGREDPSRFVLDEVAGFFLTLLLFWPFVASKGPDVFLTTLLAFVATRIFDIVKPFPARHLEALPGGWGILLDDLAASLYAGASLHAAAWLVPDLFVRVTCR